MKWETKNSGKLFNLLIQLSILLAIYSAIILRTTLKYGGDFLGNFTGGFSGYGLIILAWLTAVPPMVLRKRVPTVLEVNSGAKTFTMVFNKTKMEYSMDEFEFCYYRSGILSCLVIYEVIRASRGHFVHKERLSILGNSWGMGWKTRQLEELNNYLKKHDFISTRRGRKKSILLRLTDK
jgi:hypothetical protein